MFFIGVIRHLANKLMRSERKVERKALREAQAVIRAQKLRQNSQLISGPSFRMRKLFFNAPESGVFSQPTDKKLPPQAAMMSDPAQMTEMMQKNVGMMVPQMLTMAWVNFFFTGFVVAKVPFPLTQRFRTMLQRGVDLQGLDVTYVSSLSWYFLNLFGLRGVQSLVLGESTVDDAQLMQQQMQMGMDTSKSYTIEKEGIELIRHEWVLPVAERQAEQRLRRLVKAAALR